MSRYPKNVIDICDHQPQGTLECDCINSDVEEEKITKPQPDKSRNPKSVIDICDHQPQGTLECDCIKTDDKDEKLTSPQSDIAKSGG